MYLTTRNSVMPLTSTTRRWQSFRLVARGGYHRVLRRGARRTCLFLPPACPCSPSIRIRTDQRIRNSSLRRARRPLGSLPRSRRCPIARRATGRRRARGGWVASIHRASGVQGVYSARQMRAQPGWRFHPTRWQGAHRRSE